MFGKGISATGSLLDCAVKNDIIKKSGAWYSYNDEKIGQGRDNTREYLEQHPDFTRDLEKKLKAIIFPGREFPQAKTSSAKTASVEPKTAAQSVPVKNTGSSAVSTGNSAVNAPTASPSEAVAEKAPIYESTQVPRGRPKKVSSGDDALF